MQLFLVFGEHLHLLWKEETALHVFPPQNTCWVRAEVNCYFVKQLGRWIIVQSSLENSTSELKTAPYVGNVIHNVNYVHDYMGKKSY